MVFSHSQLKVSQIFFNILLFFIRFWALQFGHNICIEFLSFCLIVFLSICLLKPVSKAKKKRRTDHKYVMAMRFRMRLKWWPICKIFFCRCFSSFLTSILKNLCSRSLKTHWKWHAKYSTLASHFCFTSTQTQIYRHNFAVVSIMHFASGFCLFLVWFIHNNLFGSRSIKEEIRSKCIH